jgi:hypothetical protein
VSTAAVEISMLPSRWGEVEPIRGDLIQFTHVDAAAEFADNVVSRNRSLPALAAANSSRAPVSATTAPT